MDILGELNPEQVSAVRETSGPLLILAGAGSGKTKTLTHRVANLIVNQGVDPSDILAVTFTNKAAREMRQRLGSLVGRNASDRMFMPWMGTFHGICVRLLRIEGAAIGVADNFVIYDDSDKQGLIKQAIKHLQIGDKALKPKSVSSAISNAKNSLVLPGEYAATAYGPYQTAIAKIYQQYEAMRVKAGALDFDDLLIEIVRLLKEHPTIRHKWQSKFKHILVDEYQDTNAAQYQIVKLLVNEDRNICVVGDDWQSIYSWRGADFTNILNFERDFPGTKVIKLEQNYRSTKAILEAAQNVITKNVKRTDKKLWTDGDSGLPVQVHQVYDEAEEAHTVARHIFMETETKVRDFSDYAVLYRTNAQSYTLERALLQMRLPYQIVGGVRFYDRKEIKDIIAYLRLVYQPSDRMSFSRIVNTPTRGVGATSLEKFLIWQMTSGFDIVSALINVEQTSTITKRAKTALAELGSKIRILQAMVEENKMPAEIIEKLLKITNYRDFIQDGTPQGEERDENIGSLLSDAKNFVSLTDYLEEVALMSSVDTASDDNVVTLMTLHAAKGLEFPVVFMVGVEEGILPHARVYEAGPDELEEERRLCYVGMTRARQELHMLHASSRLQFGQRSYSLPSRFLDDVAADIVPRSETSSYSPDEPSYDMVPEFDINDRVESLQFGTGQVVDVDGMAVSVKFDSGTTKKLNVEYARLQKIG
ncbi:MAG: UvrD-helicase domain-containing protein [bacterium]|nr:UvrD-helicase domain-containing protein [bacterium]